MNAMKQLLKNAKLYHGSGAEPFVGDLLIDGDRIAAIGANLAAVADVSCRLRRACGAIKRL